MNGIDPMTGAELMIDIDLMTHSELILRPDPSRTLLRPFDPTDPASSAVNGHSRAQRIVDRVLALDEKSLGREVELINLGLGQRHRNLEEVLLLRFNELNGLAIDCGAVRRDQSLVIGAFFCQEYSYEAAALFNPSVIVHPDQSGMPTNAVRFILSLRGIGEGHVSSVTFRTGTWDASNLLTVDLPSPTAVVPRIEAAQGNTNEDPFTHLDYTGSRDVSDVVLFPVTPSQRQGVEDLRLVRFTEDDGAVHYLGTYTAFSGSDARSELLRTADFQTFEMRSLRGSAAGSKGMALFPRRIDGRYIMLGRHDNENIWLLNSDNLYSWNEGRRIISPKWPWEFVQLGNCGSPIEIDEGWLVMTHGVGPARSYCIGACLLDKRNPSKVLARTTLPLVHPSLTQRDGYVPNVVYSCGALVYGRTLLLPYGVADNFSAFATMPLFDLLAAMS
jgi:predicted GH43/DUF377 family glycosyl hydrolase